MAYLPEEGRTWEKRPAEEAGLDREKLNEAIEYSQDPKHAGTISDLSELLRQQNGRLTYDDGVTLGPVKSHGPVTGVVVRRGHIVAEWGEPERVDMTFSVSKSFISTVAGLAWDRGVIKDLNERVADYVDDGGYASEHNAQIT